MVKKRKLWAFDIGIYIFLTIALLMCLIPMLYVVTVSITPYEEVLKHGGFIIFTTKFDFSAYVKMFNETGIGRAYGVTTFVTVIGTALNMVLTILVAYPISRDNLPGKKAFTMYILFTMLFNGGMIPTYLIVKQFKLVDTIWALIIPQACYPYNVFLMRTFFKELPNEILEAAEIDGAGETYQLMYVALPLSKPMLMTNLLFYAVIRWNTYMSCILYETKPAMKTLQVVLREIIIGSESALEQAEYTSPTQSLKMAAVVLTALPITIIYPFIQKYFTSGIMVGAVKG